MQQVERQASSTSSSNASSKSNSTSSLADKNVNSSSDYDEDSTSRKLIRRRTVRRYQRATEIDELESNSSSNRNNNCRSQQQVSSSSTSNQELANESTMRQSSSSKVVTNRKSTTSRLIQASSSSLLKSSTNQTTNSPECHTATSADMSSSSSHFKSSSVIVSSSSTSSSGNNTAAIIHDDQPLMLKTNGTFLSNDTLFSSPDVRTIVKEIGTDFAELENALTSSSSSTLGPSSTSSNFNRNVSSLSTRLFGARRLVSSINEGKASISNSSSGWNLFDEPSRQSFLSVNNEQQDHVALQCDQQYSNSGATASLPGRSHQSSLYSTSSGDKIRELLSKAEIFNSNSPKTEQGQLAIEQSPSKTSIISSRLSPTIDGKNNNLLRKSVMSVSIERIDQRMSDLCKKLNNCQDTKEAIDLLKIMIQMIEKAWSVPVCGDDLGFKLCTSLREAGGLDIILGFIQEADDDQAPLLPYNDLLALHKDQKSMKKEQSSETVTPEPEVVKLATNQQQSSNGGSSNIQAKNNNSSNGPLRLNLTKVSKLSEQANSDDSPAAPHPHKLMSKDSDSDLVTSDLGLDSASVESLLYVPSARKKITGATGQQAQEEEKEAEKTVEQQQKESATASKDLNETEDDLELNMNELSIEIAGGQDEAEEEKVEGEDSLRKEELVFLSAKLLSQCLTLDNRNYIVDDNGLDSVIKLACKFTLMKSTQSQRLLSRSMLMSRQPSHSSPISKVDQQAETTATTTKAGLLTTTNSDLKPADRSGSPTSSKSKPPLATSVNSGANTNPDHVNDMHAVIGTEILQHLFKHSEDTCSKMISLNGLQAILYGCRSSNVETLRHCASALANLALYGGRNSQQTMIEQKAHVWLFPLAFNEDDNVQYYACLAIVVLVANQEIEADVLKSSTLDLVEPFVTLHDPQKFAESTTAHIHGQSANWLKKLVPLLESKREEARNLACFHFAMEAYIKKEQFQTEVFKDIGAVEALRKVGSSPLAIASKFACQALRLIGEKEPHKLSQQVPLWTSEDVMEWISQIGFEKYKSAFIESRIDGDLLLQLDEEMLRTDIGIDNGIIRRRFLRELSNLKRIADYSSVDKSGLVNLLLNASNCINSGTGSDANSTSGQNNGAHHHHHHHNASHGNSEFIQYIYPMLQLGVTKDSIHLIDCEQLLKECKVQNTIHRLKLANLIKELQDKQALMAQLTADKNSQNGSSSELNKTLDVFVSYRRSTGSQLASLLKVHLQLRGFSVFIDVERLEAGKFDNNLLDSIKTAKNFILVLSPNALDRCIGDHECKDWVHKEIVAALASNCNIIPIIDNFHWPDSDQLPEDMRSITYFNGVRWIHDYQDACVDKVERFIRGEFNNNTLSGYFSASSASSTLNTAQNGNGAHSAASLQRNFVVSTPAAVAATPLSSRMIPFDADYHPLSSYTTSANHNHHLHSQQQANQSPTSMIKR